LSVSLRETSELEDREKDVFWSADFRASGKGKVFGDELYLDWDIYKPYAGADFDEDELKKLKGDLDFGSKVHDIEHCTVKTADGYALKSTPENFNRTTDDFSIKVEFERDSRGGVQVIKEFIIPNARIPNHALTEWSQAILSLKKEVYEIPIIYSVEQ